MNEQSWCRAMEGLCRQRAAFFPEEHWKWLAEAEMWNHKAIECSKRPEETKAAASEGSSVKEKSFLRGRRDRAKGVPEVFGGASSSVKNAD